MEVEENQIVDFNKLSYEEFIALIDSYENDLDTEKLENGRKAFSNVYCMRPSMWLSWIRDAQSEGQLDPQDIEKMFQKAVNDYVSVELYLEYCQFMIGAHLDDTDVSEVRKIFEEAIHTVGLDIKNGSLIWQTYIGFEQTVMSTMSSQAEISQQKAKVSVLFERLMKVPHVGLESETLPSYLAWSGRDSLPEHLANHFEKACEMLAQRETFESVFTNTTNLNVDSLFAYVDFEISSNRDSGNVFQRVCTLFETALACEAVDLFRNSDVWIFYLDCIRKLCKLEKRDELVMKVLRRCIKSDLNCSEIYIQYFMEVTKRGDWQSVNTMLENRKLFTRLKVDCDEVYVTAIDCYRRFLDENSRRVLSQNGTGKTNGNLEEEEYLQNDDIHIKLTTLIDHILSLQKRYMSSNFDSEFKIARYQASIELNFRENLPKAREIWSNYIFIHLDPSKVNNDKLITLFNEYINMELISGDVKHLRKFFVKCEFGDKLPLTERIKCFIGEVWVRFERENGTWSQLFRARQFHSSAVKVMRQKMKWSTSVHGRFSENKNTKADKKPSQLVKKKKKFSSVDENHGDDHISVQSSAKKTKLTDSSEKTVQKSSNELDQKNSQDDPEVSKHTVFVSNLDFSLSKERLTEFMMKSGNVKDIRLVNAKDTGKSRGFGYVQFENVEHVEDALSRDKETIDGRPVYISKCKNKVDDNTKDSVLKYATSLERNKLFVKNLPINIKKEQLSELFSKFGMVEDIRMVTYKNGHFKGIAYVEYVKHFDASKVVFETDGTAVTSEDLDSGILTSKMSVALSNPPVRHHAKDQQHVKSLGGSSKSMKNVGGGEQRKMKLNMFVPNSVKQKMLKNE